jgi:hypothetical protein
MVGISWEYNNQEPRQIQYGNHSEIASISHPDISLKPMITTLTWVPNQQWFTG